MENNPFSELEKDIDFLTETPANQPPEAEEMPAQMCDSSPCAATEADDNKRVRSKYLVVDHIAFSTNSQKELKQYLAQNPLGSQKIVKGYELLAKTETVYKF